MKPTTILCTRCKGTGRAPLGRKLADVLQFVRTKGRATAGELHAALGKCVVTAYNNRLNSLVALGLVRRERQGGTWVYFPNQTEPKP